jgi:hypothetical protein
VPQRSLVATLLQRRVREGLGLSWTLMRCQPPYTSRAYWTGAGLVPPKRLYEVSGGRVVVLRRRLVAAGSPSRAWDMQSAHCRNVCVILC